ncbi:olfactory receptor 14J1-like [Talpa occidentalis]|uniref:olfactory receptor 14J1-like n=1 Tax=Talpa occidentalis TaxID=50954 RepID=UPI00188E04D8|nr:olfactory receptor 14J1-like [Talpa occidentalis]
MLTVMSYDHYMAICLPLHYEIILDVSKCVHGVLRIWISGVISGAIHTAATFSMHFCGYQIHQFFCDSPQVLKLSCSNEYISDIGVTDFVGLMDFLCVTFIANITGKLSRTMANFTMSGFLLMGFSVKPEQEITLASLFLVLYVVAVTGNILIITATSMDSSLHSPMYFFLKHLSFLDLCYISVTVPRSIYNSFMHSGYISLGECIVQSFAVIFCISAEMPMLTVMSYDRYVAICLPLHYEIIMDDSKCVHGVLGVWITSFEFFKPPSDSPSALDIFLTIMYTVVPPTLNPMIYSLRNKAIKVALRKVVSGRAILMGGNGNLAAWFYV